MQPPTQMNGRNKHFPLDFKSVSQEEILSERSSISLVEVFLDNCSFTRGKYHLFYHFSSRYITFRNVKQDGYNPVTSQTPRAAMHAHPRLSKVAMRFVSGSWKQETRSSHKRKVLTILQVSNIISLFTHWILALGKTIKPASIVLSWHIPYFNAFPLSAFRDFNPVSRLHFDHPASPRGKPVLDPLPWLWKRNYVKICYSTSSPSNDAAN